MSPWQGDQPMYEPKLSDDKQPPYDYTAHPFKTLSEDKQSLLRAQVGADIEELSERVDQLEQSNKRAHKNIQALEQQLTASGEREAALADEITELEQRVAHLEQVCEQCILEHAAKCDEHIEVHL